MNRKEELQQHLTKLTELQKSLQKAQQEFNAYGMAFNAWLHARLGLPEDQTKDILMPEILLKWDETSDSASKMSN